MDKWKQIKGQTIICKTLHRKLKIEQYKPHRKSEGELRCSVMVSSSCSASDTRRFGKFQRFVLQKSLSWKQIKCLRISSEIVFSVTWYAVEIVIFMVCNLNIYRKTNYISFTNNRFYVVKAFNYLYLEIHKCDKFWGWSGSE